VRWWLFVPSVALLVAAAWVLGTAWGPVVAGHPAYLVTVVVAGVLGASGVPVSLRPRGRSAPGPVAPQTM
jgi:hypothetical protein